MGLGLGSVVGINAHISQEFSHTGTLEGVECR